MSEKARKFYGKDQLRIVINEQIHDEGLWFVAQYATEAYLQEALRKLHRVAEEILHE